MNPTPIPGGLLVAIEGIDGAGKTTLSSLLEQELSGRGLEVVSSKEPTSGPWGTKLRATASLGRLTPDVEMDLLLRDRDQHVRELVLPALRRNAIVLLDRYYFSSIAYQGAAGISHSLILQRNLAIAPKPDLTILLDLEPSLGIDRIRARGDLANLFEGLDNLTQCRGIFLATLRDDPTALIIDASQSIDQVAKEALERVTFAGAAKIRESIGFNVEAAEHVLDLLGGVRTARQA